MRSNNISKIANNFLLQAWVFILVAGFTLQTCQGQSNTVVTSIGTIGNQTTVNYTLGYTFTVGIQSFIINALGFYDWGLQHGSGFADTAVPVGLWDSSGNLLASTTVPLNGTVVGDFRYELISSPLTLAADTTYYLGAFYASGAMDMTPLEDTGATTDPDIILGDGAFSTASTLTFPDFTSSGFDEGFFGPNATYLQTAPEPPVYAIVSIMGGLLGFFCWRRKRAV
jgi:Domain of unknown function (DUF4082)